jgi:hypothetical protein
LFPAFNITKFSVHKQKTPIPAIRFQPISALYNQQGQSMYEDRISTATWDEH